MAKPQISYVQSTERATTLRETRNLKMAGSAHAYVRGNTLKFYEWLDTTDRSRIPQGPPVWICGDCHVGNLGPIADTNGRIGIHIRDLDQTVIVNPAHDLIRLGLSLAMAARGSDLSGVTTARMVEQMILGYDEALADEPPNLRNRRPKCVEIVMRQAVGRDWEQLAKERLEDTRPTIPLGKRFWPLSAEERVEIERIFATDDGRRLATALRSRKDNARVEVLDAAYWMKGCSSLGRLRLRCYSALAKTIEKKAVSALSISRRRPRPRRLDIPKPRCREITPGGLSRARAICHRHSGSACWPRGFWTRECSCASCCRRTSSWRSTRSAAKKP